MKGKWKLCVWSGSIMVFAVLGAMILVSTVMSSADGKERKFRLEGGTASQAVSGSMVSRSAVSGDAVSEKEEPGRTGSKEERTESGKKSKEGEDGFVEDSELVCGFTDEKKPLGDQIAVYAERMQGIRYAYGGTRLPDEPVVYSVSFSSKDGRNVTQNDMEDLYGSEFGVDCSGLVQEVFKQFNITMPRSVKEQAKQGREIRLKDVRPGDIIFYGASNAKLTHCGIYVGKEMIVHSSARNKHVAVSDMNYRRIAKVVRVVEE